MYIFNSWAIIVPFIIICIIWVLARTDVVRVFGEPFWKGLVPGLAECEIAADLGFDSKHCLAILATCVAGIILFLIGTLPTFLIGCVCFIAYFVLFFPIADDIAYMIDRPRWFSLLLDVVPPLGFALIAWCPQFKLKRSMLS